MAFDGGWFDKIDMGFFFSLVANRVLKVQNANGLVLQAICKLLHTQSRVQANGHFELLDLGLLS